MLRCRPLLAALCAGAALLLLLAVHLAASAGEQPPADLARELAEAKAQIAELTKRLEEAERRANELADRLAKSERIFAKALAALEKLRADMEALVKLAAGEGQPGEARPPDKPIRGKVTAVDKGLGLVVINVGQRNGVKEGYGFIVFRRRKYVGRILVDGVFPDVSAAHCLDLCDAEVGDEVTTKVEGEPQKP